MPTADAVVQIRDDDVIGVEEVVGVFLNRHGGAEAVGVVSRRLLAFGPLIRSICPIIALHGGAFNFQDNHSKSNNIRGSFF